MLTEEFKQQALEKLKNATPERVVEVLETIGSMQKESSDRGNTSRRGKAAQDATRRGVCRRTGQSGQRTVA